MSPFWSGFVILLSLLNIFACLWLIRFTKRQGASKGAGEQTGHVWDGDLAELNNPLPRWWLWMFYLSIVFGLVYLALYPGLGNFKGFLGWSEIAQHDREAQQVRARQEPIFAAFRDMEIPALAADPRAREIGGRLFLQNCAQCHGSDGRGALNYPNLTDNDWLWGGAPENIVQTITNGRHGVMPPWGPVLGDEGVSQVTEYVLSLSGRKHDPQKAALGKARFAICIACHGADGKGNPALGAPNLTDGIWLHGASRGYIAEHIRNGVEGIMPPHGELLGSDRVRLLAAYVYGLSH